MGRREINIFATLMLCVALLVPMSALADDTGMIVSAGAEKKFNKKGGIGIEAEFRSRNDFRTADRVSLALVGQYKINSWLKADAGYQLLIDNNIEKLSLHEEGTFNNWRPSYWGTRHRVYASLTASQKWQRVTFSLRERWRYTYRPAKTTTRYDFDGNEWEDTQVRSKGKHTLRSRLKADWNIPKSKFSPWASVELFNSLSFDKMRLQLGTDFALTKKHTFEVFYRYQYVNSNDDGDENIHYLGLGYKFKF